MTSTPSSDHDPGSIVQVETAEGPGRFFVSPATAARATLVLGHGAGGGVDAIDLLALARGLPGHGITLVRFEQPWRTAGGRVAVRPPRLDRAWDDALSVVLNREIRLPGSDLDVPLFVGGRSAGARVACRTSAAGPLAGRVSGVVACAFPLHPPGRPDRSRAAELLAPSVPRLVLQGERDSFGGPDDVRSAISSASAVQVVAVPGADHSMRVTKAGPITAAELRVRLVSGVVDFVDGLLGQRE